MKLSRNEMLLLQEIQFDAWASSSSIQKRTGLKDYSIRYSLNRLRERGLIRFGPNINVYPLGLVHYGVFFSLASGKTERREKFVQELIRSPEVSFFVEVGGDYQYGVSICVASLKEASRFLNKLSEKYEEMFFDKVVATRTGLYDFPYRTVVSPRDTSDFTYWGIESKSAQIDQIDHVILRALSDLEYASRAEVARLAGIAASTLDYRLRKLREAGILARYRVWLDTAKLGYLSYYLLVYTKGTTEPLTKRLLDYVGKNSNFRFLVTNFGAWDYEIGLEVKQQEETIPIIQTLCEEFASDITQIKTLPVFAYRKVTNYPFKQMPGLKL